MVSAIIKPSASMQMQILTLQQAVAEIVQTVRSRHQSPDRAHDPFFLIVGSGLSSPPLPTASEMEVAFRERLEEDGKPLPELPTEPSARYARLFEAAYPQAEDRRHYLENLLRGKALSAANLRLAHFLGGRDGEGRPHLTHLVVTPNFDDQLSRSLRLFGYDAEVIDNPDTVALLDRERTRDVQIVHVHGTYRHYDCRNLLPEITANARSRGGMKKFLAQLLDSHRSPVVLGYSGWEGDVILSAVKEHLQRRRKAGLANKIYWFCYRRENLQSLPSWLRNDRNVVFVLPEEPARSSDPAGALATNLEEREAVLPAHRVIGALIHAFGVDPPRLASDPLGFLAAQLRLALDLSFSEAEPALYNLERVLQRVERGKTLEAERWTITEKSLQAFWDAVQRGDDEGAVVAAETLVTTDLDLAERARVVDQLYAARLALPANHSELGLRACEVSLSLAPRDSAISSSAAWKLRQARALVGRGYRLGQLGRAEEAFASYAEVLVRFGDDPTLVLQELVAGALVNQGYQLGQLGRAEEALGSLAEVLKRFGDDPAPALREAVARALVSQAVPLSHLGRADATLASYAEVLARFGDDPAPALREQVAMALFNQGVTLGQLGRKEEALASYAEVLKRFGDDPAPSVQEPFARALVNQGGVFQQLGRNEEALASFAEVLTRFSDDPAPELREQAAMALLNKGLTLSHLGRADEALASYAEVLARCGDDPAPSLLELVAKALLNQGVTLGELGRVEEALAKFAEVVRRFGDEATPVLREQVAKAMVGQGLMLVGQVGRVEEELATYAEVVKRFGNDPAAEIQKVVELARQRLRPQSPSDDH